MQDRYLNIPDFRIGQGYDVHQLAEGRKLILGGVEVEHEKGLLGHSDADVLLHAIMDSILGAMGLGDIGSHFPDTNEEYRGISSLKLLEYVRDMVNKQGFSIQNIDATIIAQAPKLSPFIPSMKKNIDRILSIGVQRINIKATTTEKLGFEGRCEGISAHAVCLLIYTGGKNENTVIENK